MGTSPYLNRMLTIMRKHYKDTIWPDMKSDFKNISAPVIAISPSFDGGSKPAAMRLWGHWTSAGLDVKQVASGHMDCIFKPGPFLDGFSELQQLIIEDLLQ